MLFLSLETVAEERDMRGVRAKSRLMARDMDHAKGEVWLASRDGGMVSSAGRFINSRGFVLSNRRREMLTAFDRPPARNERVTRVAPGDGIRSFGWSEDVILARALALLQRIVGGRTIADSHRNTNTRGAYLLLARARDRVGPGGKGVPFHRRMVRLRDLLVGEMGKVKERRIALFSLAETLNFPERK